VKRSYLKRGTKRLGPGKKVRDWESARRKLKMRFEIAGITSCELRWGDCAFDNYLGFAHAQKRRNVKDLNVVILACNFCHDQLEIMPNMERIVTGVIAARKVQP
jgi:hypothetical protein